QPDRFAAGGQARAAPGTLLHRRSGPSGEVPAIRLADRGMAALVARRARKTGPAGDRRHAVSGIGLLLLLLLQIDHELTQYVDILVRPRLGGRVLVACPE